MHACPDGMLMCEWGLVACTVHPRVSVEMCVLKLCVGFGMYWAGGGCVSRELKVLDKTKWIWQARLIRQRFWGSFPNQKKEKKHRLTFLLSPRRLLIMSLSPSIKLSMFTNLKQREEITTLHSWQIENSPETMEENVSIWNDDLYLLAVSERSEFQRVWNN